MSLYTSTLKIHAFLARMIFEQPPDSYVYGLHGPNGPNGYAPPCALRQTRPSAASISSISTKIFALLVHPVHAAALSSAILSPKAHSREGA
jgi:hypothetical protein